MKLKYLFTAFVSALLLTGCSEDNEPAGSLGNISLSDTYATLPDAGGSKVVTVTAAQDWQIDNLAIDPETGDLVLAADGEIVRDGKGNTTKMWFTMSQLSGQAGETELTITAGATESGREQEVRISVGDNTYQFLVVRQGSYEVQTATCADVLSNGIEGKTYRVKGTVTAISSDVYGNMYLNDGTGELYIYGTLDADGAKQNFASLGIEVGDEVEVEGPLTIYKGTTYELVDVTVVNITKSLLKIVSETTTLPKEGGELEVKMAFKGSGAYVNIPDEYKDWIVYKSMDYIPGVASKIEANPADTAVFKFNVLPNAAGTRTATLDFNSSKGSNTSTVSYTFTQEGSIVESSIADFNAAPVGATLYRLSGVVTRISDAAKGQFYIKDYSGETYIYNYSDFASKNAKVGDIVTVVGKRAEHEGTIEMTSGEIETVTPVKAISVADFRNVPDSKTDYYRLTGKVEKVTDPDAKDDIETYGNFNLTDATGSVYVYGVTTGWGGESKKFGTLGVKYGDTITIIAIKSTYKGLIEAVGNYESHVSATGE